jgi:hypothetical protein
VVDEEEFRRTRAQLVARPCPFQAALFAGTAACRLAERVQLAERQSVNCREAAAQARCARLFELLRDKANFALGRSRAPALLPFGQAVKIQAGGLLGLRDALEEGAAESVDDVDRLLSALAARFGDFESVPFERVVRRIAHYRRRGGGATRDS